MTEFKTFKVFLFYQILIFYIEIAENQDREKQ